MAGNLSISCRSSAKCFTIRFVEEIVMVTTTTTIQELFTGTYVFSKQIIILNKNYTVGLS